MKPNIVLIVLDSVRQDHLSCYGHNRPTTPCIDTIAAESLVFENARSASCWTLPSHASLFTGCYPSRHRADFDTKVLSEDIPTLAELLQHNGYETVGYSCNMWVSQTTGLNRGFERFVEVRRPRNRGTSLWAKARRKLDKRLMETQPDRGAAVMMRMVKQWLHSRTFEKPFFLFLNFMECHLPYVVRSSHLLHFTPRELRKQARAVVQDAYGFMANQVDLHEEDFSLLQLLYDGSLYYIDQHVGKLYSQLKEMGLLPETVFIITSDHGENFGEHGLMDHQFSLHETLLRVPLILRMPEGDGPHRITRTAQITDVAPTLLRAIREPASPDLGDLQGLDLLGSHREVALAEYLAPNTEMFTRRFPGFTVDDKMCEPLRAICDLRWKYIWHGGGRHELYDLAADPVEQRNLILEQPDLAHQLDERLHRELGQLPSSLNQHKVNFEEEAMINRLRELGYL